MNDDLMASNVETSDDLARLRQYIAACGPAALASFNRHLNQPRYRPAFTRILERSGVICGYALLSHIRLRLGSAILDAGQMAMYVPKNASETIARERLLLDCLYALAAEQLTLALIEGLVANYGAFGFADYRIKTITEYQPNSAASSQTLRLIHASDLDDLAALYSANYRSLPLTTIRSAPDWRYWLADEHNVLGLEDAHGRLIGYATSARLTKQTPATRMDIYEAAAADAGAARWLCLALLNYAQRSSCSSIALHLSPWHSVSQAALQLHGHMSLELPAIDQHVSLAGILDLPATLAALAPEFSLRLAQSRYADWKGNLRLELASERVTLALEAGKVSVIDGTRPADLRLRQITLAGVTQLCLGFRTAADLRATGDLKCDDVALGLLDVLFPVVLATY